MDDRFSTAQALFKQRKFSQSASILTEILDSDNNSINALTLLAQCMLSTTKIDDTIRVLERIFKVEPQNHEASNIILEILKIVRNTYEEKDYCKKIIAIN